MPQTIIDSSALRFNDGDAIFFGNDIVTAGSYAKLGLNSARFDMLLPSSGMKILPYQGDAGVIQIGDGTTDIDVKIFLGSVSEYVLFDVGNSRMEVAADVIVTGDLTLTLEDVSIVQGRKLFLDGQDGGEYVYSDGVDELMVNATKWIDFAIGGADKVRLETSQLYLLAGVYLNVTENVGIQKGLIVNGNATFSGNDVGITGTLTVITALNNGYDAAGGAVNFFADSAGSGVFFDPTADSNKGALSIGASGGSKGTDAFFYGETNGAYVQWDASVDDLILVGGATIIGAQRDSSKVLFVDVGQTTSSETGHRGDPYKTIGAAVAAIVAFGDNSDDVAYVIMAAHQLSGYYP